MKYFTFLVLLPCIFAAEIQNAICVDGTQCPLGKYCCESGCCAISKEMQDKGYVTDFPPSAPFNVSLLMKEFDREPMHATCNGTLCGELYCVPNNYDATCCTNPRFACPSKMQCCNSSSESPWCCHRDLHCGSKMALCINSAVTISTVMISVQFAFVIGIVSKYFL